MKALLVNTRGNHVATIDLPNCPETPHAIAYNKRMYLLAGDVALGFIFKAESFMIIFDDNSEVVYDAAGRKASTKDKYGTITVTAFQVPTTEETKNEIPD